MVAARLDPNNGVRSIITRPDKFGEPRVFALTDSSIHPLRGLALLNDEAAHDSEVASALKLGPPLKLHQRRPDGRLVAFSLGEENEFWRGACDASTGLIYIGTKSTILQLDLTDSMYLITVLAGMDGEEETVDGPGTEARVDRPFCMVADGHGSLLIKDCGSSRIRRVVLPPYGSPSGTPSPLVITLPIEYAGNLWALAIDYADPQQLYVATKMSVYRHTELPYSTTPPSPAECEALVAALAAMGGAPPDDDPSLAPALLAGHEGDNSRADGVVSGLRPAAAAAGGGRRGQGAAAGATAAAVAAAAASTARFSHITYMVVDETGRLIIAERDPGDAEPTLRIVWPCGLVTSFAANFEVAGSEFGMALLPGGWLALHAWDATRLQLLRMGPEVRPSLPGGAASGGGGGGSAAAVAASSGLPGLPGLAADLAALLDGGVAAVAHGAHAHGAHGDGVGSLAAAVEPAAAADVMVVVGSRSFGCHRAILSARCEYFRRLFQGGFADSSRSTLSLPDADPEAFALLLRYLYCAHMDFPSALLRPLAELADRLLLPDASRTAQQQLLAATSPASVVDDLLWAEGRGFGELLGGLKDFYLAHAHDVLEEAPGSLETLMTSSPRLHLELYAAGIKRARRG